MFVSVLLLCLSLVLAQQSQLRTILVAPNTPFTPNGSVDLNAIRYQARYAKEQGANTIWAMGSLGEFASLTTDERKLVANEWVKEGKKNDLFVIIQVGSTTIETAQSLAQHAQEIHADAISAVPPFYYKPSSVEDLVRTMSVVAAAAPDLPFYYYHIPDATGVNLPMLDFFNASQTAIPSLRGVKFVSDDMFDYLRCVEGNWSVDYDFMWAEEPKLASFELGARSFVIAESYFVSSLLRMWSHWVDGDHMAARNEQMWKWGVGQILGKYGQGIPTMKATLNMIGIPIGLTVRLPFLPVAKDDYDSMRRELTQYGFLGGGGL